MTFLEHHTIAFSLSFKAMKDFKTWLYLIPSIIIGLVLFLVFSWLKSIFSFTDSANEVPLIGNYLSTGISYSKGFFGYIGDFIGQFFMLTLLSPVFCLLSEWVDTFHTKQEFQFSLSRLILDFFRMLFLLLISTILYFTFLGAWWILSWLFGLGKIDFIVSSLISAFFFGFSFFDYSYERYKMSSLVSLQDSFENILYLISIGLIFTIILYLPYVGMLLAPFIATIISTYLFLSKTNRIRNES